MYRELVPGNSQLLINVQRIEAEKKIDVICRCHFQTKFLILKRYILFQMLLEFILNGPFNHDVQISWPYQSECRIPN